MTRTLLFIASHLGVLVVGFALGVYLLPILSAPPAPSMADVQASAHGALYHGEFRRSLPGSDALHWGEGRVTVSASSVTLAGRLAPGPAYRLYLVRGFVEDEAGFRRVKAQALAVGDIRTFDNFIVPLPPGAAPQDYDTAVVWCEAFSRFITAAKYR